MRNAASVLKILIVVIVAGLIVTYTYYKTKDFLHGPVVIITSPVNGATVNDSLVEIVGKAKRIAYISINDRQIFTNEEGNFKEKLLLYPGYNIISIKVSDRFDRNTEKSLEIVYRGSEKGVGKIKKTTDDTELPNSEENATTTDENISKLLN